MSAPAVKLELRQVTQSYPTPEGGTLQVVADVSLLFDAPGINMLLGPSGCGKSTVLKMMGGVRPIGILSPTSGEVLIDDRPCHEAHDDAVMVFQRYANRPDLSVWDNVAFPFRLAVWKKRVKPAEARERVAAILDAVGLADKRDLMPSQLSGGQNQRVALARALVLQPRILLMDEPFGALDAQTRGEMQRLLSDLHQRNPCLVIFVTHDVSEALVLGDRVLVMSTQPARIASDFVIRTPRPRGIDWLRTTEARHMEAEILALLHQAGKGRSSVSITV